MIPPEGSKFATFVKTINEISSSLQDLLYAYADDLNLILRQ